MSSIKDRAFIWPSEICNNFVQWVVDQDCDDSASMKIEFGERELDFSVYQPDADEIAIERAALKKLRSKWSRFADAALARLDEIESNMADQ